MFNDSLDESNNRIRYFGSLLYDSGKKYGKEAVSDLVIQNFPKRFQDSVLSILMYTGSNKDDIVIFEKSYKKLGVIFLEFSDLIKVVIANDDIKGLEKCLNQYSIILENHNTFSDFEAFRFKSMIDKGSLNDKEIKKLEIFNKFYRDGFAVVFGNLCLLLTKIFNRKLDPTQAKIHIELLYKYIRNNNEDIAKFCIEFFNGREKYNWHEWIWNLEERPEGEIVFVQQEEDFIATGLIFLLLKEVSIFSNVSEFGELDNAETMLHWVEPKLVYIENNKEILYSLLDESKINSQIGEIKNLLNGIKKKKDETFYSNLANEPLSNSKIDEFKQNIYSQWRESRGITHLLKSYGLIEKNADLNINPIGFKKMHLRRSKFLFTEKYYQPVYGINWGYKINEAINNFFVTKLIECTKVQMAEKSILELLDDVYNSLITESKDKVIFIIPVDIEYQTLRELNKTGIFELYKDVDTQNFSFNYLGIYREKIILTSLRCQAMNGLRIGFKIPGTILLQQQSDPDWHEGVLELEVRAIDRDEAISQASSRYPEEQISNTLIDEIMTDVIIEINERVDFKIIDHDKIIVYKEIGSDGNSLE